MAVNDITMYEPGSFDVVGTKKFYVGIGVAAINSGEPVGYKALGAGGYVIPLATSTPVVNTDYVLSGVQAGGFESSVPDGLRLLAAQVERKGRAVLQEAVQRFRGELRRIHSEAGAFRGVAHVYERQGPGRPTVVTPEMLTEAHRCRSAGLTPDATVRALCEKFTASESALRSNLKRGAVPSTGGPTAARLLHLAVYGGGMAPAANQRPADARERVLTGDATGTATEATA